MRKSVHTFFLVSLILAVGCDPQQDAFEESLPDFYTLTTQVSPDESGTVKPSGGEFLAGNSVLIEATPADGYVFDRWEGDITGNSNPESIRFNTNRTVTAHFSLKQYNLKIDIQGNGTVRETVVERSSDVTVRLEAVAGEGWRFVRWNGDLTGNNNPDTITLKDDEEKSVTAIFEEVASETFTLTVKVQGEGSVEKDPDKSSYKEGEKVKLTARPASGWSFKEWKGDLSGNKNPAEMTLDKNKSVTAVFEQVASETYTLTVKVQGEGSVEKDPDKSSYKEGEKVELTARPASGWSFKEWKGDLSGSKNPATITLDKNRSVTAIFEQDEPEEYSLTVHTEGDGSVSRDPNQSSYTDGEKVTLTAIPASGWSFKEWKGDLSGSKNPATITLDQDKSVTALFEQDEPDEMSLSIDEVKLFIEEMALEGARNTGDFKTKDFILHLPLDGSPFEITHVQIPAGFYEELELEIKRPGKSDDIDDPDFRDGSDRYSLVVHGIFNGVDFTFQSADDLEIEIELEPHLQIKNGQKTVIPITIDFESWFRGDDGEFLDPSDSRNAKRINKNIEESFSDFEDRF
jgi:hypothetical protein